MRFMLLGLVLVVGCTADNADLADGDTGSDLSGMMSSVDGGNDHDASSGDRDGADSMSDLSSDMASDMVTTCTPTTKTCGKCGTSQGTCVDGKLTFGSCMNEGPCTPGDSYGSADGCQIRTCGTDCKWGLWNEKPGKMCVTGGMRGCDAGLMCGTRGIQKCIACLWAMCMCP